MSSSSHDGVLRDVCGSQGWQYTVRYDIFFVIRNWKKYRTVIPYRTWKIVSNRTSTIEYRTVISYQISYLNLKKVH